MKSKLSNSERQKILRRARRFVHQHRRFFLDGCTIGMTGRRCDVDRDEDRAVLEQYDALHRDLGKLLP